MAALATDCHAKAVRKNVFILQLRLKLIYNNCYDTKR